MNILQLYQDYNVPYPVEGERHYRSGWINTRCPFCTGGHEGYHLGFELSSPHFFCWRCGWHPVDETISALLNISKTEAKSVLRNYQGEGLIQIFDKTQKSATELHFPTNTCTIGQPHRKYLLKRGFDPDEITQVFKIQGTGPVSRLKVNGKSLNYKHRIIIPYHWGNRNQAVSFDSRDISNKHPSKYLACPSELEVIPHKDILYGMPMFWGDTGICVEGCTDVWRLGVKTCAVSGIQYTVSQVRWLKRLFKKVYVVFDDEPQAQEQAQNLVNDLRFRGLKSERIVINGSDPGDMRQDDADYLVKQLLKTQHYVSG